MKFNNDFVSFNTAKQLKKSGFNGPSLARYNAENGEITISTETYLPWNDDCYVNLLCAPTLYDAQKWLRDEKGIHLSVHPMYDEDGIYYKYEIYNDYFKDDHLVNVNFNGVPFKTYEQALDNAIDVSAFYFAFGE